MKSSVPPSLVLPRPLLLASWLVAGSCLAPLALAQPASSALQQSHDFSISAGPLPGALDRFSRITGLSLVYTGDELYELQVAPLQGRHDAATALSRLLEGSGYTWRMLGPSTLTLEAMPVLDMGEDDGAGLLNLSSLVVSAEHAGQSRIGSYQPSPRASIMRSNTLVLDIPQTINSVPAQVLRDQRPRNLDDALNNVSGITQANTLGGTQDAVMKRGFGDNRDGSIMRDGMTSVLGRNLTASVDHVEVLKGPASLLYGIQDPGGVVNLVDKKPQLTAAHSLGVRGMSYAHARRGGGTTLDTTGPLGNSGLAYRLVVDYEDEDYWRNFGTTRQTVVSPSLAWYGERTRVNLNYEHRDFRYPFDRGTVINPLTNRPLNIPKTRRLDERFNITDGKSDLLRFSIDQTLNEHWKGQLAYGWTRETYDDNQARVTAVNATTQTLTRRVDATRGAVSSDHLARLSLNGDFELLGLRHELLTGFDFERRRIFRRDMIRGSSSTFSYTDPDYGQISTSDQVDDTQSHQLDRLRSYSAYLQDSAHLTDHWILVLGTRWQHYNQLAGRGRPFQANTNLKGHRWTPRAGLVYKINDQMSLYGSYTYSFKPNSTISPLANNQVLSGAVLPEEARSVEIGGKLDIPGWLTASLALYDIHKRNVLVSQLDSNGDTYSRAAGKVRSYGVELDVSGQLSPHWSLIGSYAWTHARVTRDPELKGNRLQNVARNTGSLSAVHDFGAILGASQLRAGAGLRYVGRRAGDSDNSFSLPGYAVSDLFATYDTRLGSHELGLQLNIKNLFDRRYYASSASRYYVSLGEARQFQLSGTLAF